MEKLVLTGRREQCGGKSEENADENRGTAIFVGLQFPRTKENSVFAYISALYLLIFDCRAASRVVKTALGQSSACVYLPFIVCFKNDKN